MTGIMATQVIEDVVVLVLVRELIYKLLDQHLDISMSWFISQYYLLIWLNRGWGISRSC